MTKTLLSTILVFAFVVGSAAQDKFEDPKDVIEAVYNKTGGDKWKSIKSMVASMALDITSMQGEMSGSFKMSQKYPGYIHVRILMDMEGPGGMPMGAMTQVITPDTGYVKGDFGTQPLPKGTGPKHASEEYALLSNADAEITMAVGDRDGREVYAITSVDGETTEILYYDVETLTRVAKKTTSAMGEATMTYDDFREVDGVMVPHKMVQEQSNGMVQTMRVKTIEFNADVSDKFETVKEDMKEMKDKKEKKEKSDKEGM